MKFLRRDELVFDNFIEHKFLIFFVSLVLDLKTASSIKRLKHIKTETVHRFARGLVIFHFAGFLNYDIGLFIVRILIAFFC